MGMGQLWEGGRHRFSAAAIVLGIVLLVVLLAPAGAQEGQEASEIGPRAGLIGGSWQPESVVSAGSHHTCAVRADGGVDCWGYNYFGQAEDQAGPFVQVSVGSDHSCGLRVDGRVDCWGWNDELGQATDQAGPFRQVSAAENHTCGLYEIHTQGKQAVK